MFFRCCLTRDFCRIGNDILDDVYDLSWKSRFVILKWNNFSKVNTLTSSALIYAKSSTKFLNNHQFEIKVICISILETILDSSNGTLLIAY